MASGTINLKNSGTTSGGGYLMGKVTWSSTTDTANNKSSVTAKLYVKKAVTSGTITVATTGHWDCSLTVNGSNISDSVNASITADWVLLLEKTVPVNHNSDGSRSITISASAYGPSGTSYSGLQTSGSDNVNLDTIPRATVMNSLSCETSYFDGELTYKYTPQSASFYNKLTIYLSAGDTLTAIRTTNLGKKSASQQTGTTTLSSTELTNIYKALPNAASAKIRITVRTYSNSGYTTQIGSPSYKEVSLTIPASVKPSASLAITLSNSNEWIKSKDVYVQNYSGLTATLSGSAGSGASISAYNISGGGYSSSKSTLTVSKITASGDIKFTGKITDSRGRSASVSQTITVLPYTNPAITSLKVERGTYDGGWTANETGGDVRIIFKTTIALDANGNVYSATFKVDNTAATPDYGTTTGLKSGASMAVYLFDLDGESSHTLKLIAKDSVGNSSSATITIPTINVTIEFNDSGKGIAFGKTSEKDAFECLWPAYFTNSIYTKGFRIPEIQCGSATITVSSANTPASLKITFDKAFSGTPIVVALPQTTAPGTDVLGVSVSSRSTTGCTLWVTRASVSNTVVNWIAMY